jgi:D-methionine transport system substrate-binding protein
MQKKIGLVGVAAVLVASAFGACTKKPAVQALQLGVTAGPHAQIANEVARLAAAGGLTVNVVEFNDYVQPNLALADKSLDANSFQHRPYLEQQSKARGHDFEAVALTVTFPIAAYSERFKRLSDIPTGGIVAIPNDPTNGARALHLLEHEGLLRLAPDAGLEATVQNVVWTKGELSLKELDAAQLPRALPDVAAAVINTNYALEAGLDPVNGSLAREAPDGPYANLIVVRRGDGVRPDVQRLVEVYHLPEVRAFIDSTFHGAVVPSW